MTRCGSRLPAPAVTPGIPVDGAATLTGTDAAVRLPVSRRFDATAALGELARLAARGDGLDQSATLAARAVTLARTTRQRIDRVQRKTDALMLAAALAVATVIALLVVFV